MHKVHGSLQASKQAIKFQPGEWVALPSFLILFSCKTKNISFTSYRDIMLSYKDAFIILIAM